IASAAYDPAKKTKQTFTVEGTLTPLPANVTNTTDKKASISVTVDAEAKTPPKPPVTIDITSITNPASITGLKNGTPKTAKALGLPTKVEATLRNGSTIQTEVNWQVDDTSYDPDKKKEQTFTVKGTIAHLPSGVLNPQNLTAKVQVTVDAEEEEITGDIVTVEDLATITVANGTPKKATALGLPEEVQVKLDNDRTTHLEVDWDVEGTDYDPSNKEAQKFRVTGNFILPNSITNTKDKKASIQVKVRAEEDTGENREIIEVINPRPINGVDNGTAKTVKALGLPDEVKVKLDDDSTIKVSVKWNVKDADYDPEESKRQRFEVEGTLIDLPEGVENSQDFTVSIRVTVEAASRDDDDDDDNSGGGNRDKSDSSREKESTRSIIVEAGKDSSVLEKIVITRKNTTNGKKVDEMTLDAKDARKILKKAEENKKDVIRILIDSLPKDPADEVLVTIPGKALALVKEQQVSLEIKAEEVFIKIPKETMASMPDEEIYFRVIPIREQNEADQVKQMAGGKDVLIVENPVVIETNYRDRRTNVVLPLSTITLPTNSSEQQAFLDSLLIYVEHTDGNYELKKGTISYDAGKPVGIEVSTNQLGTFTILSLKGKQHLPYMKGYPDNTFQPNRELTRAEVATMLVHFLMNEGDQPTTEVQYADVKAHWAADSIQWVTYAGLMDGDSNGFHPDAKVSRAEMATIIYRWKNLSENGQAAVYSDTKGSIAESIITTVTGQGFMKGYEDGTFRPNQILTRAEAVTLFNRLTGRTPLKGSKEATYVDVPKSHWAFEDIAEATTFPMTEKPESK
ncbi:S-layer homology domain-containing protein, partial [Brevibacillus sp. NPDC003359]|uniref:S-layer homology domain-containing protein n=1 Tax=unclassified Brevibacillus TaxID=2684853 RepID=UPI003687847B